ncbi:MAG: dTDP-4-dehydrorhamnose 3,5-epimerase [Bacteroidales bacterium]|nr:dTDP-4-dehydrorhamnose 3,5-epimerase [Bacteroidales bacterium]MDD4001581.1 dTDP-4-dehydrorhamnose 3,5-epimerase [Bacteroidales bacterium]
MKIIKTPIPDLLVVEPSVFNDQRGYFFEVYNQERYFNNNMQMQFVQDNESKSGKNVLRGLHFQKPPFAQGKLVRVIQGKVLDVAVDIRKGSPTYGSYHAVELDAISKRMFYIPEGFAHGFLTMEEDTIFAYKCTNYYNKESEGSLLWSDETIGIKWNIENPILSEKDKIAPLFKDFNSPFKY